MYLNPFPPTLKFTYIAMFPLRKTRKRISKFGQLCYFFSKICFLGKNVIYSKVVFI